MTKKTKTMKHRNNELPLAPPTAYPEQLTTHLNAEQYELLYEQSIQDPNSFWGKQAASFISWFTPWDKVIEGSFKTYDLRWFVNGTLNACYNCVDRHLPARADKIALYWEGNDPKDMQSITYQELHHRICKLAHVLKKQGIKKGDRVGIYLPMIPETIIAMLACARIGAVHSVVFGGFSAEALKTRLLDADCHLLITADAAYRGDKLIPLKQNSDTAIAACPQISHLIVIKHTGIAIPWDSNRDIWYHDAIADAPADCPMEPMEASDPLFILYTSGSTGKPKGILHSTGGYLVYAAMTHHYVFDYHESDIYWCTADIGWITGHTYVVYGPLANGATTVIFEGVPHYPTYSRYWDIIDKYHVTIFYTAPTAIRALRREGDAWVQQANRQSLRLLGSVGEPINPEVWTWYYTVVGGSRCPIVNTWWQTETGGILLTALPGVTPLVPGSVGIPFFGIQPEIVDDEGLPVTGQQAGFLAITNPWPGLMQSVYGDHERFITTYLTKVPGFFITGDGAYRESDGSYWITGRTDDVMKVSGHRIGTEEIESALVSHPSVSEAAVVGIADDIKGEHIYAFVTLKAGVSPNETLKTDLVQQVRTMVGPLATPETIQFATGLPKTRSGKIMRRILRHIANKTCDEIGDTSTLADESVLDALIKDRP